MARLGSGKLLSSASVLLSGMTTLCMVGSVKTLVKALKTDNLLLAAVLSTALSIHLSACSKVESMWGVTDEERLQAERSAAKPYTVSLGAVPHRGYKLPLEREMRINQRFINIDAGKLNSKVVEQIVAGREAFRLGQFIEGARAYDKAVENLSQSKDGGGEMCLSLLTQIALQGLKLKHYREAESYGSRISDLCHGGKDSSDALRTATLIKAEAQEAQGQYDKALQTYEEVLKQSKLPEEKGQFSYNRAEIYDKLKKSELAQAERQRAEGYFSALEK